MSKLPPKHPPSKKESAQCAAILHKNSLSRKSDPPFIPCAHPFCNKKLSNRKSFSLHLNYSSTCFQWCIKLENMYKDEAAKFTRNKLEIPDESAALLADLILDDNDEESSTTSNNNDLIDNPSSTFASCFTINDYAETKSLKTLRDYNVPHMLYQNIMDWVTEAQSLNYSFIPTCSTCVGQINHLEKLMTMQAAIHFKLKPNYQAQII